MVHRETDVPLFPITVLVGPNNGGKSALFDALVNFSMVSRGSVSQAFGPGPYSYAARRYHGAGPAARVSFDVVLAEGADSESALRYRISYAQIGGEEGKYVIFDERIEDTDSDAVIFDRSSPDSYPMGKSASYLFDDRSILAAVRRAQLAGEYEESHPLVTMCAREISRLSKFRLDPANLARPSTIPEITVEEVQGSRAPRLDYHGELLPSVLYYLSETEDPALSEIVARIRSVLTGFEGFEFNTVQTDRIGFSVKFADSRGAVPAANLSHGTLSLIGMMVLLLSPDRPPLLCLEEPENGLTPRATRAVYEAIRDLALKEDPSGRSQILLSSHSPFVICAAWNGEERDFIYQVKVENGSALIRAFAEIVKHQEIQLRMEKGERKGLGLEVADQVMEGYYS